MDRERLEEMAGRRNVGAGTLLALVRELAEDGALPSLDHTPAEVVDRVADRIIAGDVARAHRRLMYAHA